MKRKKLIVVVIILLLCALTLGVLSHYQLMRPILLLNSKMTVGNINIYVSSETGPSVEILDFNRDLVLECLDASTIQWVQSNKPPVIIGKHKILIVFRETDSVSNETTFIYLGETYTVVKDEGVYEILNGDRLYEQIKALIDIE